MSDEKIDKNDRIRVRARSARPDPTQATSTGEEDETLSEELAEGEVTTDELGERLGEEYLRGAVTGEPEPAEDASPNAIVSSLREELSVTDDLPDETDPTAVPSPNRLPE
jgi:hypothetical protein